MIVNYTNEEMKLLGIFDRFSIPNYSKKVQGISAPKCSPIIGQASTFKTLATFDLDMDTPRFIGDVPRAEIKSYEDFK